MSKESRKNVTSIGLNEILLKVLFVQILFSLVIGLSCFGYFERLEMNQRLMLILIHFQSSMNFITR